MKLIFLDIDGVLNGHDKHRHPNGYCGIDPACVYRLNRIVAETGAYLVISSAWRYLLGPKGGMSPVGFKSMLMTYGLDRSVEVVGRTPLDERISDRGPQVGHYLAGPAVNGRLDSYVILDDGSDDPPHPPATKPLTESLIEHHERGVIVFTDGTVGLTDADADRAIRVLNARSVAERDDTTGTGEGE